MSGTGDPKYPVVRFKKWIFILGPRFWIALILIAAIVVIGFLTNPANHWAGALVAVSAVLGVVLGVLLQVVPVPPDHSQRTAGALRSLASIADNLRDTGSMVDQVTALSKEEPTRLGLVAVQADLTREIQEVELSMLDWDGVTPGSLEALALDRRKGLETLARLSQKEKSS